MLLRGAMLEIGLEIEPEVGCVGGCGGCAVAVPKGVWRVCGGCAEGVCAEVVRRVCRGVGRWGNECMSYVGACAVAVLEHVSEDVAEHVQCQDGVLSILLWEWADEIQGNGVKVVVRYW